MSLIFVNTDNTDSKHKIYIADKAGAHAAAVEKKMQDTIVAAVAKAGEFTTDKSAADKGYTLKLTIIKAERSGATTTYTVHPEIVRYPLGSGTKGKGEEMVSTLTKDPTIEVKGNSKDLLLEGVELVTENIVKKALPLMRMDMAKR